MLPLNCPYDQSALQIAQFCIIVYVLHGTQAHLVQELHVVHIILRVLQVLRLLQALLVDPGNGHLIPGQLGLVSERFLNSIELSITASPSRVS